MQSLNSAFFVVSGLLGVAATSSGQLDFSISQQRQYRQHVDGVAMRSQNPFPTGSQCYILARLVDGSLEVTGCPWNGSEEWFPPVPLIGCEIGATGCVVGADLVGAVDDNGNQVPDGVADNFTHWEVKSITPATGIHYFRPDKAYLHAVPSTELPHNQMFNDESTIIYYNTQVEPILDYYISGYYLFRDYHDRNTMDSEIVPGEYQYRFPRINDPDGAPVDLKVTLQPIPEGYEEKNHVGQGFRFTRLNGQPLAWSADGYVEIDPRLTNIFEWAGNDEANIFVTTDIMYFSIASLTTPTPGPPNRMESVDLYTGRYHTLFPQFRGTPATPRVGLPHALTQSFGLPGRVIPVQDPPLEGVVRLELIRDNPTTAVTSDKSYRCYQLPVRSVNTYAGWAAVKFPVGTPENLRSPGADPDDDGYSNEREWQAGTNPMNPAAPWPPGGPVLTYASWIAAIPGASAASGFDQDADDDGIPNGIEHVLGTRPDEASQGLREVSRNGSALKFRHSMSNDIGADVSFAYEWSADLRNWHASGETSVGGMKVTISTATVTNVGAPALDEIEVTATVTEGDAGKLWVRMKAYSTAQP